MHVRSMFARLVLGVLFLVSLFSRVLSAQFFRAPVFIAQPGVIAVEAVSSEKTPNRDPNTHKNDRSIRRSCMA